MRAFLIALIFLDLQLGGFKTSIQDPKSAISIEIVQTATVEHSTRTGTYVMHLLRVELQLSNAQHNLSMILRQILSRKP